jgi:aspartate-semialdehyde dehydrogenase
VAAAYPELPTPGEAAGRNKVLVDRIRQNTTEPNGLARSAVNDNLRQGRSAERDPDRRARSLGAPITA